MKLTIRGRVLVDGDAAGELLIIKQPISFLGMIDPMNGQLKQLINNNTISIQKKILWIPYATGSTVGAYIIYQMSKNNVAPLAILAQKADTTLSSGCALSNIPLIDLINNEAIPTWAKYAQIYSKKGEIVLTD